MASDYLAWRDRLAHATEPAFWPIEAIDSMIIAETAHFWGNEKAALVTRTVEYPTGTVALEVLAGAGDLDTLLQRIAPEVERQAKDAGMNRIYVIGRAGWERALKDYRKLQVVLVKDLADGQ